MWYAATFAKHFRYRTHRRPGWWSLSPASWSPKSLVQAREVAETFRKNTGIDWALREQARARLRAMVKHLLRKYGYLPDLQEQAVTTVIQRAGLRSHELITA
jgi:hypothetical protein